MKGETASAKRERILTKLRNLRRDRENWRRRAKGAERARARAERARAREATEMDNRRIAILCAAATLPFVTPIALAAVARAVIWISGGCGPDALSASSFPAGFALFFGFIFGAAAGGTIIVAVLSEEPRHD